MGEVHHSTFKCAVKVDPLSFKSVVTGVTFVQICTSLVVEQPKMNAFVKRTCGNLPVSSDIFSSSSRKVKNVFIKIRMALQ